MYMTWKLLEALKKYLDALGVTAKFPNGIILEQGEEPSKKPFGLITPLMQTLHMKTVQHKFETLRFEIAVVSDHFKEAAVLLGVLQEATENAPLDLAGDAISSQAAEPVVIPTPTHQWKLNEGSGSSTVDFVTNASTSLNGPAWSTDISPVAIFEKQTGTTANTVPTIKGLSNTAKLITGMTVTGNGILPGSVISSIDSATQITMNNNATATATDKFTFTFPNPSSLVFDGIDDYVEIANLDLGVSTFSVLFKLPAVPPSVDMVFIGPESAGGWYAGVGSDSQSLIFGKMGGPQVVSSKTPELGTSWHHAIFRYDGNAVDFYLDSVLVSSAAFVQAFDSGGDTYRLGGMGTGGFFQGNLDEARTYSTLLSSSSIAQLTAGQNSPNRLTINLATSQEFEVGQEVVFDKGTPNEETVIVLASTGLTITAEFTKNHGMGSTISGISPFDLLLMLPRRDSWFEGSDKKSAKASCEFEALVATLPRHVGRSVTAGLVR